MRGREARRRVLESVPPGVERGLPVEVAAGAKAGKAAEDGVIGRVSEVARAV